MRVLYVEDNPANVFLVKRVAKMGSHEIINFVDGTEALARFKTINPDLVLMDIQIAGELNGLDVVKRLRSEGVTTPIIAVTAYAMVGDRERCLAAGCTDYMAKPLPIAQLVQIFQHYADHSTEMLSTSERLAVSVSDEREILPTIAEKIAPITPAIIPPVALADVPPTTETPAVSAPVEPVVEPTIEPTVPVPAEPAVEPAVEPIVPAVPVPAEPVVEPAVEPTVPAPAKPVVDPTAEPTVPTASPSVRPSEKASPGK